MKWFDVSKGFGFVVPENESFDVFLHVTTLKKAGIHMLGEGACLLCHIERRDKGFQVTEVVAILDEGIQPLSVQPESLACESYRGGALSQLTGTVKFYNTEKGFGFVIPDDGQRDVFLHKHCLDCHGLKNIEPGTPIIMNVRSTFKGREVIDFYFLAEPDL